MNGYGRADFCARVTSTRLFTQRVLVDLAVLHDDLEFFSGSVFSNHPHSIALSIQHGVTDRLAGVDTFQNLGVLHHDRAFKIVDGHVVNLQ